LADGIVVAVVDRTYTTSSDYTTKFLPQYKTLSGGAVPNQVFHAFAFDGYNILVDAIEKSAIGKGNGAYLIPRQALRDELLMHTSVSGLTSGAGKLNCNDTDPGVGADVGDCSPGSTYYTVDTIKCPAGSCNFTGQPLP
jgi:hypothetical protein